MKRCVDCNEVKSDESFRAHRHRCRKCNDKIHAIYAKNNPAVIMLQSAKFRAKRYGLPFSLKKSDIIIPDVCPVLGYKLVAGDRHNHDFAPTIDRIKPELGYVPGNIVVVSYRANRIKNDATFDELVKIVSFYEEAKERQWESLTKSAT